MAGSVLIVGAGIVGVCCGVELAEAGWRVHIVDRDLPGGSASRWNAGVLATSSLVPLNRPGLAGQLPRLLLGRSPGFRLAPRALGTAATWVPRYVSAARSRVFAETVDALDGPLRVSVDAHRRRLQQVGRADLWSEAGWLILCETDAQFSASGGLLTIFRQHGVAHEVLGPDELSALEPDLARRFARAIWLTGSAFVSEPAHVLAAYFERFRQLGGGAQRGSVVRLEQTDGPAAVLDDGSRYTADHVVVAAGPWSAGLLATIGQRLPMMSERGYVRRFPLRQGARLQRPIYDVAGGLVLSPRPEGVQLSTGTELTLPHLPGLDRQREPAAGRAARLLPLEPALAGFDAWADRPTLPDSRPAIGRLKDGPIWLCCGHQHIGFSTATGSAQVLAALMRGVASPIDAAPFAPGRFGL
jgi:D-amino-acid dehydrogenase